MFKKYKKAVLTMTANIAILAVFATPVIATTVAIQPTTTLAVQNPTTISTNGNPWNSNHISPSFVNVGARYAASHPSAVGANQNIATQMQTRNLLSLGLWVNAGSAVGFRVNAGRQSFFITNVDTRDHRVRLAANNMANLGGSVAITQLELFSHR